MGARHADWLRQAEAGLRHARHAREGGAHEWACFAAQQAAEKAIKAVVPGHRADARGHAVTVLIGEVATAEDVGPELIECAKTLDKHYIPTRYPSGFDAGAPADFYTSKDSNDAVACAERLIDFARGRADLEPSRTEHPSRGSAVTAGAAG